MATWQKRETSTQDRNAKTHRRRSEQGQDTEQLVPQDNARVHRSVVLMNHNAHENRCAGHSRRSAIFGSDAFKFASMPQRQGSELPYHTDTCSHQDAQNP